MKKVSVFSVKELKEKYYDGYESAYEEYKKDMTSMGIPWQEEIMDSMKSTFKAAGVDLKDWEISDCSPCYVKFSIPTYWSELADEDKLVDDYTGKKALNWLKDSFELKSVKRVGFIGHDKKKHYRYDIVNKDGKSWDADFTGYCADYDFMFSLLEDVSKNNCTLYEAFDGLADVAGKLFRNEWEYIMSEEAFMEDGEINERYYTKDGTQV